MPVVWSWGPVCLGGCQTQPVCARTSTRPAGCGSFQSSTGHGCLSTHRPVTPVERGVFLFFVFLNWALFFIVVYIKHPERSSTRSLSKPQPSSSLCDTLQCNKHKLWTLTGSKRVTDLFHFYICFRILIIEMNARKQTASTWGCHIQGGVCVKNNKRRQVLACALISLWACLNLSSSFIVNLWMFSGTLSFPVHWAAGLS